MAVSEKARIGTAMPTSSSGISANGTPSGATSHQTLYKTVNIDGLNIAYREAGIVGSPKLVLLHGFPASSHQYRELIPPLAENFHVIAPDYPGFGMSDMPDPANFAYTFDKLADITARFLAATGFARYGLYMQDYGGPVGFRIMGHHLDQLEWMIVQNSNAYEVGFTAAWDGFRKALWVDPSPETEKPLAAFLEREQVKSFYLHGARNAELISPDNWVVDSALLDRPNAKRVQLDLFYDYRKNVPLYEEWHAFMRKHQPKTIIFWGQKDIFFNPEGGEAYLEDLPHAEMHRLDGGHFAVEDHWPEIAAKMLHFYSATVVK